jgi:hypothetical protein
MNIRLVSILFVVIFVALIPFGLGRLIFDLLILANSAGVSLHDSIQG